MDSNGIGNEERKENQSLRYIGQSLIVSPEGDILSCASAEEETLRITGIDPDKAKDKALNPFNDLFADRRREMYTL